MNSRARWRHSPGLAKTRALKQQKNAEVYPVDIAGWGGRAVPTKLVYYFFTPLHNERRGEAAQ
jgi:hypothetical protein